MVNPEISLEPYRLLFAEARDIILFVRADGTIAEANAAAVTAYGYPRERLLAMSVFDLRAPETVDQIRPQMAEADAGGILFETRHRRADGSTFPVEISSIGTDAGGERLLLSVIRDVTERKQSEAALDAAHRRTRTILESIADAFYAVDRGWRFTYVNPQAERYLGANAADLLGRTLWEAIPVLVGTGFELALRRAAEDRVPVRFEAAGVLRPDRWGDVRAFPSDEGLAVYWSDATDRIRAERALEERERQLRLITDAAPALIALIDRDARYVLNNATYEEWFGIPRAELRGRTMREVLGDAAWTQMRPYVETALGGRDVQFEERLEYRTAGVRHVRGTYVPSIGVDGAVDGVAVMVSDITDQKRLERDLRASRARFEAFMDNSPLFAFLKDARGRYVYANRAAGVILGRPSETWIGRTDAELFGADVEARFGESDLSVLETGETRRIREDIDWGGETHHVLTVKFRTEEPDGEPYVGVVAVDITDLRRFEEALTQADRRKDEFLAMLAHELRNPLAPIRSAVDVLRLLGPDDGRLLSARDVIERQLEQLTRLVDDLLDVSRITRGKIRLRREPLDLYGLVARSVEAARPLLDARGQRLVVELPPENVRLDGDAARLAQALGNLLSNASKFTDEGGEIRTAASVVGEEVVIAVRDEGIGIAPEMLPHVFDLFAQAEGSLDRSQGGLGIGLTLVRSLVELHGGAVEARSEGLGRGSEFVVRLPAEVTRDAPAAVAGRHELAEVRRSAAGRRILVVDDNADSADMLRLLLELSGHEVAVAHDGPSALERASALRPQAIVLDIGLPGMDGYEVARCLRARPETNGALLVALTGYGQEQDRRRSAAAGFDVHLVKPVDPKALEALIVGRA